MPYCSFNSRALHQSSDWRVLRFGSSSSQAEEFLQVPAQLWRRLDPPQKLDIPRQCVITCLLNCLSRRYYFHRPFIVTSISGRVYGIEPTLESAHFITDILSNSNELFLVNQDGQKPSESANPQLGPREGISALG